MTVNFKTCTRCKQSKPLSEFKTKVRKTGAFPASSCKECDRAAQRARWHEKGKPKYGWSKTPYAEWTPEMRAAHHAHQQNARQKTGGQTLTDLNAAREQVKKDREVAAQQRKEQRQATRKTPPSLSEAERFRWRYTHDEAFREKQKARTRKAKAAVPIWYANQMLGGRGGHAYYPLPLLLAKQVQLKISRHLKEQSHEEY